MSDKKYKYIFGPIPSRRLGLSLGVDLVPFKTCCFDCVYCQIGRTTDKTVERREYVPVDEVIAEIKRRCDEGLEADYITMSGSGEPTLNSGIGRVIAAVKEITRIPVAVITNGGLLSDPQVRRDLLGADLVVPSLDGGNGGAIERVDRPDPSINFDRLVEGLVKFREEFSGQMWLEVFIVEGLNDDDDDLRMLVEQVELISPDCIQMNTVVRPAAESYARRVGDERMREIAAMFGEKAEIILPFERDSQPGAVIKGEAAVLEMISRRPCSLRDISSGLGMHENEVVKYASSLKSAGKVVERRQGETVFYSLATQVSDTEK